MSVEYKVNGNVGYKSVGKSGSIYRKCRKSEASPKTSGMINKTGR